MTGTTAGTAQRASDAMKDLVAVTEHLEQSPSDATWASGSLLAVTSRLAKTLHQLAEAHRANNAAAHSGPASSRATGRVTAFNAATEFDQAARALASVYRHLDHAAQLSMQIDWDTAPTRPSPAPAPHTPTRTVPPMRRYDVGLTR